ncbi:AI-2E family transporter [Aquabacterium sp.]|uniref:AI-2E family transporter n=1 Tax=Aquabacterium sp. TaxID=1872578 RepID=UPI002E314DB7|nr:AI-2E family transporter [Aquabacterium sp.]HEX5312199.1 AI-2E family transporter [Aquabacterium sp.]
MTSSTDTRTKLIWSLLALGVGALLWRHATVLAPFFLSLVLAYSLQPVVERLVQFHLPRVLAVALSLVAVAAGGAVVVFLLVPIMSELGPRLRTQLPDLAVSVWHAVAPWLAKWGLELPTSAEAIKAELIHLMQANFPQWSRAVLQSVLIGGSGLLTLLGFLFLVPVLTFYCLLDWHTLTAKWRELLPPRYREVVHAMLDECDAVVGQYLRGQLLVMLILAVYYGLALSLAGFELGLPIGVFTGLAIFVPYLGYGLGLLLAVLAGLLQYAGASQGLVYPLVVVAVVYGAGQIIESIFLTPRLVGERIGLHPVGVILALMLFGQWAGLLGVLIALPAAAVAMVLLRHLMAYYRASRLYQG